MNSCHYFYSPFLGKIQIMFSIHGFLMCISPAFFKSKLPKGRAIYLCFQYYPSTVYMLYTAVVQFSISGVKLQLPSCHRHVPIPYWLIFQVLYCLHEVLPRFALLVSFLGLHSSGCTCRVRYPNIKLVLTRAGYVSRVGHGII